MARRGNVKGAVVPRPFAIGRDHSGGVASPVFACLARHGELTSNPTTTGDTTTTGYTRYMECFPIAVCSGTQSNFPLVYGPRFPLAQTAANPVTTDLEDWKTIDTGTPTTRRIWGLVEALHASEYGGYERLVPCAWDATLHITVPASQSLLQRVEPDADPDADSTFVASTGVNMSPFYIVATCWFPSHNTDPLVDMLAPGGTIDWGTVDLDDLRRGRGIHIWKVYPSDRVKDHSFTVSCYDTLSQFKAARADDLRPAVTPAYFSTVIQTYRDVAATLAEWDTLDITTAVANSFQTRVDWYLIKEPEPSYAWAGTGTGYTPRPFDVQETHFTGKTVVQQKWLFYERDDPTADDTTAT